MKRGFIFLFFWLSIFPSLTRGIALQDLPPHFLTELKRVGAPTREEFVQNLKTYYPNLAVYEINIDTKYPEGSLEAALVENFFKRDTRGIFLPGGQKIKGSKETLDRDVIAVESVATPYIIYHELLHYFLRLSGLSPMAKDNDLKLDGPITPDKKEYTSEEFLKICDFTKKRIEAGLEEELVIQHFLLRFQRELYLKPGDDSEIVSHMTNRIYEALEGINTLRDALVSETKKPRTNSKTLKQTELLIEEMDRSIKSIGQMGTLFVSDKNSRQSWRRYSRAVFISKSNQATENLAQFNFNWRKSFTASELKTRYQQLSDQTKLAPSLTPEQRTEGLRRLDQAFLEVSAHPLRQRAQAALAELKFHFDKNMAMEVPPTSKKIATNFNSFTTCIVGSACLSYVFDDPRLGFLGAVGSAFLFTGLETDIYRKFKKKEILHPYRFGFLTGLVRTTVATGCMKAIEMIARHHMQ